MNKQTIAQRRNARGQGMTEYIIIVALIAVAAIGVTTLFGKTMRTQVGAIAAAVGGDETNAKTATAAAKTSGGQATTDAKQQYNMSNFADNVGKQ